MIGAVGRWLDARLRVGATIKHVLDHRVPRSTASWFYVFGSAAFVLLLLQVVTGICLACVYVPSAANAWSSLQELNHAHALGWFLRALHGWGSTFMVAIVLIHMTQVFLFGAFKYPRELTWTIGVVLLLLTLGMAFTGQVLRFDEDSYWGVGIGAAIMGRVPLVGAALVHLLLGGPIIASATLSRFFALHVFVVPGLLLALAGVHVLLVVKLGTSEWPMPGRVVTRATYLEDYDKLVEKDGVPFYPDAFKRDLFFAGLLLLAVVACAAIFGPFGPSAAPDPTHIEAVPRPDYFFLWMYAALALLPPSLETPILLVAPVLALVVLFGLPFFSGVGEKSWRRRPVSVLIVLLAIVSLAALTHLGKTAPWSPEMSAWSAAPIPPEYLVGRSPLERQGALVLQNKQCRDCHALDSVGGRRGPALDEIAARLTRDELIRQVVQGGGNMPAYGKNLRPPEITALVAFLETLRGGREPARNPAPLAPGRRD